MTRAGAPPLPQLGPRPAPGDFVRGLVLPFRTLGFILRTPRLRGLSTLCALVTLLALVGLGWLLLDWSAALVGWMWPRPTGGWGATVWGALRGLVYLVLFVAAASSVPPLLLTPLQDPLSEATEELCGGFRAPPFRLLPFVRGVGVGLVYALARLFFLLAGLALLLPLHLVPGVGSLAWTVLASAWTMAWLAAEHLGGAMARHFYPFSAVRRVLAERPALCLGFGAAVYVLLWVPVLNTFFLPVAVVGGTLLFRALQAAGSLPPPTARVAAPR